MEITLSSLEKYGTQNVMQVAMKRPEGSSSTKVTHDWTNPSTWYQGSVEVTGEAMTNSGLVYSSANDYWIDLTHGKVYAEDDIENLREPKVYDNAIEVTDGFSIDYESGEVTFDSAPTGPVTCDYWYGADSTFTLSPIEDKVMIIEHAELQFTKDIEMQGAFHFEVWVYNPADLPNKVPYQTIKYKNMKDIINASNLGQGYIPAIDIVQNDVLVFPFNYATVKPFPHSSGAELRVKISNDVPALGEWATATFYILSEDEL